MLFQRSQTNNSLLTALSKTHQMQIALKDKSGPKQQEFANEEKEWLRERLIVLIFHT